MREDVIIRGTIGSCPVHVIVTPTRASRGDVIIGCWSFDIIFDDAVLRSRRCHIKNAITSYPLMPRGAGGSELKKKIGAKNTDNFPEVDPPNTIYTPYRTTTFYVVSIA